MRSFLSLVVEELNLKASEYPGVTFVLPSRRAGSFLLKELSQRTQEVFFSPEILSIESFVEEIAEIRTAGNLEVLFELYEVYLEKTPSAEAESFKSFSGWGQTLLHDFNEIDRYLIDSGHFFNYLEATQKLALWNPENQQRDLLEKYLSFWNTMPDLYKKLRKRLLEKRIGYQGLVYRKAHESVSTYLKKKSGPFFFVGFNALNKAEQEIFQIFLESGKAQIFWDIDRFFWDNERHEAGHFFRQYFKEWKYYKNNKPPHPSTNYSGKKKVEMIGLARNIGQAKYVGEMLSRMTPESLSQTALILSDEKLLLPLLNSLPPNVKKFNVTMGLDLLNFPLAELMSHLLHIHFKKKQLKWYYKDVQSILTHPLIQKLDGKHSRLLIAAIRQENLAFISYEELLSLSSGPIRSFCQLVFRDWNNQPSEAIENLRKVLHFFKEHFESGFQVFDLEVSQKLEQILVELEKLVNKHSYIKDLETLLLLYGEKMSSQKVDLKGDPYEGLQIMGVLESRVLDFERVIVTSLNEGVLPAGKTDNSFIPFDIRCALKLPTYREKDAIYAYHFYHLLQRSSEAFLLYNAEKEGLNAGEKSRFLLQLDLERQEHHELIQFQVSPDVPPMSQSEKEIVKTERMLDRLKDLAQSGFSPSALLTYIRNPLDFYTKYVLRIEENQELEETIAYNTLGTVVHDTLETLYTPYLDQVLKPEDVHQMLNHASEQVEYYFQKHYQQAPIKKGKNLLILEVAQRYVQNFLNRELLLINQGNEIKILGLETKMTASMEIPGFDFPVKFKGTVDRIDRYNGKCRIIDYKTGKVDQNKVEIIEWEDIISDYDRFGKPFQILLYVSIFSRNEKLQSPVEAGIISFKNLNAGFLRFCKKEKKGKAAEKEIDITLDTVNNFEQELIKLLKQLFDPSTPFKEKKIN